MSIAAALGNMGLALRDINNEQRAQNIQDEEIAARREERKQSGQLRGLQIGEAMNVAADRQKQRGWDTSYQQAAQGAPDEETTLKNVLNAAKQNGDVAKLTATRTQLAALKADQLKQAVNGGLRQLMGTGDPTGLQAAYNNLFPDGNRVNVERTPDNKYNLQFVDASGQVKGQQPGMTVDQIGMAAMKLMDPKFAQQAWMDQLKDDREIKKETKKGEIKLDHDKQLEAAKAGTQSARDAALFGMDVQKIGMQGAEARKTGASNAAAHGLQSRLTQAQKATLDGGGPGGLDVKEQDKRVQMSINAVQKAMGEDEFGRLKQTNQPLYLATIKRVGERVRAGANPEQAASEVMSELIGQSIASPASRGGVKPPGLNQNLDTMWMMGRQ